MEHQTHDNPTEQSEASALPRNPTEAAQPPTLPLGEAGNVSHEQSEVHAQRPEAAHVPRPHGARRATKRASAKRQVASRANGRKSRGPLTPEGKARSSRNATTHGLCAEDVVLPSENPDAFDALRSALFDALKPLNAVAEKLAEAIVVARWRHSRIWEIETTVLADATESHPSTLTPAIRLSRAFRTLSEEATLFLLDRYESRYERQFARSIRLYRQINQPDPDFFRTNPTPHPLRAADPVPSSRSGVVDLVPRSPSAWIVEPAVSAAGALPTQSRGAARSQLAAVDLAPLSPSRAADPVPSSRPNACVAKPAVFAAGALEVQPTPAPSQPTRQTGFGQALLKPTSVSVTASGNPSSATASAVHTAGGYPWLPVGLNPPAAPVILSGAILPASRNAINGRTERFKQFRNSSHRIGALERHVTIELVPPETATDTALPAQAQDPVETLYQELEAAARVHRPKDDFTLLRKAFEFARKYHEGQTRASGEPYMAHPVHVALILAGLKMDLAAMQTGLLHDVVEDTSVTIDEVRKEFGPEVARCVDGVTKLSKLDFFSAEERQAESVRKMLLAMVEDLRVIMVKLADRLHNMRTLGCLSEERKERIARETLEIYSPIAHRLGMGKIRGELEDLALQHLEPDAYSEIVTFIESRRVASEDLLTEIRHTVEADLRREGVPARIEGRIKRPYSVFQKLRRQKIAVDQVYDLVAVRIITDSVKSCYAALGIIHNKWRPIPGRIKDFIAIPRPNLYQSLHTSVVGPHGQTFEVQIRTEEMHRIAEEGIAAHWKYKEGKKGAGDDDQRIAWLRHLIEWQREVQDPTEFLSTLKVDLYPQEVYAFTPKGKVIVLPRDATPIDFAYAIHSDVGATCNGAKVNGRLAPLRSSLKNGDIVEILTQSGHVPTKDWLTFVKTARARNRIKHFINATERVKAIEIGQKYLEKEARRFGVQLGKVTKSDWENTAGEYGYGKIDDLYAALGYGKYSARQVLAKIAPEALQDEADEEGTTLQTAAPAAVPQRPKTGDGVIKVSGIDDLMVYRAGCCNPIRGEAIVGYVTRGKGVAVHSKMCPNVTNLMYEVDRKIEVEWERAADESFPVHVKVHTDDRPGLLNQLTSVLSAENANIRSLEAKTDLDEGGALVEMTIDVKDKKQLEKLVGSMRRISGVRDVERLLH